jgi:riboflavin kinase/FMN adenylyltransferase
VLPLVQVDGETVSSTAIRALLLRGDLERANALLGHPHILSDTVRSGFHIGRTLDYPTVNMRFEEGVLVPRRGVYAVRVLLPDGSVHGGVTNIGVRPTFEGERMTVETNIFDLNADLYGRRLTLEFYGFLRPERKFDDAEQLRRQIGAGRGAGEVVPGEQDVKKQAGADARPPEREKTPRAFLSPGPGMFRREAGGIALRGLLPLMLRL